MQGAVIDPDHELPPPVPRLLDAPWWRALHARIKFAWVTRGISQQQFADELGVEEGVAEAILDGTRIPLADELARMPTILQTNGDWLLTGEGPTSRIDLMLPIVERTRTR